MCRAAHCTRTIPARTMRLTTALTRSRGVGESLGFQPPGGAGTVGCFPLVNHQVEHPAAAAGFMVEPLPGIEPHRERAFAPVPKLGARAHAGIRLAEQRQGNGSSQCGEVERRGRHDASPAITRRSDCSSASGAHHGQSGVHEHGRQRRVASSSRRRARDSSAYHCTRRNVESESTDHPGMPVAMDGAGRTANSGPENRVTIRPVARPCDSPSARPGGSPPPGGPR